MVRNVDSLSLMGAKKKILTLANQRKRSEKSRAANRTVNFNSMVRVPSRTNLPGILTAIKDSTIKNGTKRIRRRTSLRKTTRTVAIKKEKMATKKPDMSNVVCFNCDKKGHFARDCKSKRKA